MGGTETCNNCSRIGSTRRIETGGSITDLGFSYQIQLPTQKTVLLEPLPGGGGGGGGVWHQHRLEAWFTEEGEIASVFPSGFGENGNQARPYTPCQEGDRRPFYPNSAECVAVRECKFILISAWSYFCLQTMMTSFLGIPFTAPVHS